MYWKKAITPPHPKRYLNSCASLGRTLRGIDGMPVLLVCAQCWRVLRDAFGNQWTALWWIFLQALERSWRHAQDDLWYFWQKRIMRKSEDEIDSAMICRVKKSIGVDLEECAERVGEAEFEEWLDSMLSEGKEQ
jgi:hypothetical protein